MKPIVSIILGSKSDWPVMEHASHTLTSLNISHDSRVLSAHRTPDALLNYVLSMEECGVKIFIAAAGGAAHLPGVIASSTLLPVIGVPMTSALNGLDSLLSIVQMPSGIPVATMAIGKAGAVNAALYAASMLSLTSPEYRKLIKKYREDQAQIIVDTLL
ncbi:5-(carboxyamino)imidazole ribonucleotide mutase [Legionella sp.]|uniref:5-(carboxyamino)imidazole ribonucleotide mutase n=1 Tax=Legionella sp. TaxID=459 RepID=UPI003C9E93A8